ncbi:uncharacterized protein FFFS_15205 [Fusarium fujikuroi]|nr:uncharacterized protein FFFS_15205 [Fusarium fujikuroi]
MQARCGVSVVHQENIIGTRLTARVEFYALMHGLQSSLASRDLYSSTDPRATSENCDIRKTYCLICPPTERNEMARLPILII